MFTCVLARVVWFAGTIISRDILLHKAQRHDLVIESVILIEAAVQKVTIQKAVKVQPIIEAHHNAAGLFGKPGKIILQTTSVLFLRPRAALTVGAAVDPDHDRHGSGYAFRRKDVQIKAVLTVVADEETALCLDRVA